MATETLLELDFGDAEFVVKHHPDGMYTVEMSSERLVLNEEQLLEMLRAFQRETKRRESLS